MGWTGQMLDDTGYGPSVRRRGSGNMLTHTVMGDAGKNGVIGTASVSTLLNDARSTGCVHEDRGAGGHVATGTPGAATCVPARPAPAARRHGRPAPAPGAPAGPRTPKSSNESSATNRPLNSPLPLSGLLGLPPSLSCFQLSEEIVGAPLLHRRRARSGRIRPTRYRHWPPTSYHTTASGVQHIPSPQQHVVEEQVPAGKMTDQKDADRDRATAALRTSAGGHRR